MILIGRLWNAWGMISVLFSGAVGWYVMTQLRYIEMPKGRLVPQQEKQIAVAVGAKIKVALLSCWLRWSCVWQSAFF